MAQCARLVQMPGRPVGARVIRIAEHLHFEECSSTRVAVQKSWSDDKSANEQLLIAPDQPKHENDEENTNDAPNEKYELSGPPGAAPQDDMVPRSEVEAGISELTSQMVVFANVRLQKHEEFFTQKLADKNKELATQLKDLQHVEAQKHLLKELVRKKTVENLRCHEMYQDQAVELRAARECIRATRAPKHDVPTSSKASAAQAKRDGRSSEVGFSQIRSLFSSSRARVLHSYFRQ